MDTAVVERDVEEVVQVLREGDEWWRFFQTRHRSAVAFHKKLAKNKKVAKSVRREELEALHAHLKETRLAKEDLRYRKAMGAEWRADATEFDALHAVASWIESANTKLLDAELDASTFSPLTVTAAQVAALSKSGDRFARAQQLLNACFKHVTEGALKNASGGQREFVEPLARAAVALGVAGLFCEVHPRPDRALSDGPNSLAMRSLPGFLRTMQELDKVSKGVSG